MLQVSRKHCMGQKCDISSVLSLFFILKTEDFHTFEDGIQHVCIDTISGPLREESRKLGQRLTHAAKSSSQKLSTSFLEQMNSLYFGIPSRELTYPTWGKGKSFSRIPWVGICWFPGGYSYFFSSLQSCDGFGHLWDFVSGHCRHTSGGLTNGVAVRAKKTGWMLLLLLL